MSITPFNMDNYENSMDLSDAPTDWHSQNTITFGSLIEDGFDWGRNDWTSYTMKEENVELIRERLNRKIEDEYFFRELGTLPPARFKRMLVRRINSAVDAQGLFYDRIVDGLDLYTASEKGKARIMNSEYPQSRIAPETEDYFSNSTEQQSENISTRNHLDVILALNELSEPDAQVIEHIRVCFSNLISHNY